MPNDRIYFIGLLPSPEIQKEITSLKEYFRLHYGAVHALKSPPHITLFPPFKWRESGEHELVTTLDEFTVGKRPIDLVFQDFGSFPPHVIYIKIKKNEYLTELFFHVTEFFIDRLGIKEKNLSGRPYHPHLTLAHKDLKREAYHRAWKEYQLKNIYFECRINSVTLLKHDDKNWNILHESTLLG